MVAREMEGMGGGREEGWGSIQGEGDERGKGWRACGRVGGGRWGAGVEGGVTGGQTSGDDVLRL